MLRQSQSPFDLHVLRAGDPHLDTLANDVQQRAAASILFDVGSFPSPILITGSSGYLGKALVLYFRRVGIATVGVDVVEGPTTDIVGSVAEFDVVARAGRGCRAVIHTAALHAPHASAFSEEDYFATNVTGTTNVLQVASAEGFSCAVITSTTSLMVTEKVHEMKSQSKGHCAFLNEALTGWEGPPRNKYGRTKLEAERRACHHSAITGLPVVILRTSRFFPEDILPEQLHAGKAQLSMPNVKANELLGGRVALEDVMTAHLSALARAAALRCAIFTISAPTPFSPADSPELGSRAEAAILRHFPHAADMYRSLGWTLPQRLSKVKSSHGVHYGQSDKRAGLATAVDILDSDLGPRPTRIGHKGSALMHSHQLLQGGCFS